MDGAVTQFRRVLSIQLGLHERPLQSERASGSGAPKRPRRIRWYSPLHRKIVTAANSFRLYSYGSAMRPCRKAATKWPPTVIASW